MAEFVARNYLFIINDAPYGNERPYNALRLAYRSSYDLHKLFMNSSYQNGRIRRNVLRWIFGGG